MYIPVHCEIVSADEHLFSGMIRVVVVPGSEGELGVTYGHTPLLTGLKPGPVRLVKQNGKEKLYYLSGGFIEVQPHKIIILADKVTRAKDLDEVAAREAKKEAERAMKNRAGDLDYLLVMQKLTEATAQLRTLKIAKSGGGVGSRRL